MQARAMIVNYLILLIYGLASRARCRRARGRVPLIARSMLEGCFRSLASAALTSLRRAERPSGDERRGARTAQKKIVDDSPKRKKISTRTSVARRNRAARDKN
jgi:hypothetical protein